MKSEYTISEKVLKVRAEKRTKRKKAASLDLQKRNDKRKKKTAAVKKQPESIKDRKTRVKRNIAGFYGRMRALMRHGTLKKKEAAK